MRRLLAALVLVGGMTSCGGDTCQHEKCQNVIGTGVSADGKVVTVVTNVCICLDEYYPKDTQA